MKLFLNHKNIEGKINEQLKKLKMASDAEIAKCVSQMHSHDLGQSNLPVYDAEWVISLVGKSKSCECKDDIISALEYMSKFERYDPMGTNEIKYDKFMTWDIGDSNWQGEYKSGHIGRYVWDIAAIINHMNNPALSGNFLERYMQESGRKFTLAGLYANLYYVKAAEAVIKNDFEDMARTTKKLTDQNIFETELIPDETIARLKIIGF